MSASATATPTGSVDVNGVRLYYELHGSGEPLVLVHGSWGDARSWRFVVPGLAARHPAVFRSLSCHEPPLWSLLEDRPALRAILQQGARSVEAVGRRIAQ